MELDTDEYINYMANELSKRIIFAYENNNINKL